MKLGDFDLFDGEEQRAALLSQVTGFNETRTDYPRNRTVHGLFCEQARATPDAVAVFHGERTWAYRELEEAATRFALVLMRADVAPESCVAIMLEKSFETAAALIGTLLAGCAYVPLAPGAPQDRLRQQIDETGAGVLVTERRHIRLANRLQWMCRSLRVLFCADSRSVHSEHEGVGDMMREDIWDQAGAQAFDDISGGGWTSSYTGEWLSREVMDQYGNNALLKLSPYADRDARVLEIGCASGITMFRIAPRVASYCGTDLSGEILRWTTARINELGVSNIALHHLAAHEIDRLPVHDFDVVILNSVVQCFSGYNYLRDVLRKAIALMKPNGVIFLGNLWDLNLYDRFVEALESFRRDHGGAGGRVKIDRSEELFVSRAFLEDLRYDLPALAAIETSTTIGEVPSELSEFGYDAVLHIAGDTAAPTAPRHRVQLDLRSADAVDPAPLPERSSPNGLAYVMYTSGTSGRQKGVMIDHRAIVRLVRDTTYVQLGANDRCLQTGALGFDACTFEIWGMLLNGGAFSRPPTAAILDTSELTRLIRRHGVTTMWLTATLFNTHVDRDAGLFAGLKYLIVGGEKLSPSHVNRVREAHRELTLINGYGPTENTTFTACHHVAAVCQGDVPIGRPIANTQVWVVDGRGEVVPIGVAGEICAAGDGLARGYYADAGLTAEKFVPHPFAPGARMYRTGDLGRWTSDGLLEYLGRRDEQVKIRGFRVEPDEIVAALLRQPGVRQAAVVVDAGGAGAELDAFVTGDDSLDPTEVHASVRRVLPDYMVPRTIARLEQLPLTSNGKLDRRALPVRSRRRRGTAAAYAPPNTNLERALVAIWEEALGHSDVGITDNFFEAGGHSLKVARVMGLVQQRLGVAAPLTTLFRAPTVREFADALLDVATFGVAAIDDPMVRLGASSAGRPLFAFPPGTGDAAGFFQVAERLDHLAFYAFNFIESDDRLQRYADLIAGVDREGPYTLFGYSSGGNLAYHVAGVLEARGRTVADIVMIDSARKLVRTPFSQEEINRIADEFLGHESVRHYLTTPILRERAHRLIERSYAWIEHAVDFHRVRANLHVLTADDSPDEHRDRATGTLLASRSAWAEVTSGSFQVYPGEGDHNHLLHQPYLERNVEILRNIIDPAMRRSRRTVAGAAS